MNELTDFNQELMRVFTIDNFYGGNSYLEYIATPQTNDEDNIVDTKIMLPLLAALGFASGDIAKNTTARGKDNTRPDFQVSLNDGKIRCFLVEDKHTAYDLSKPEPLQQLLNYAASRGYELGLICNGKLLLGWDLSNQNEPNPVLSLNLEEIIKNYSQGSLTSEQVQGIKGLYSRFHRQNFEGIDVLIENISKPVTEWLKTAISQSKSPNFDELLIEDLRGAINLIEEDVLYQLSLLLEDYEQYYQTQYLPNGNGNSNLQDEETAPKTLVRLRKEILNYLRVSGLLTLDDYSWANERLIDFAEKPRDSIQQLADQFLERLQAAEQQKQATEAQRNQSPKEVIQLDLLPQMSENKQKELGIKVTRQTKITKLDNKLTERLKEYESIVFDWKAWQARQSLTHAHAIQSHQYFISWKNLISKTVLQGADEQKLKEEFARQTAYVYVIRLLMVRICEDKGLINRKFSDGGFKQWMEEVVPQYLDFAQGMALDYLLDVSYRSAQSIYAHFFSNQDLFSWYRMSTPTLIRVLHILNRFNLEQIDSDIIGTVYGRYVIEGKHEQGRYFTPKLVVEYILDRIGYTSDNPDIRDKTLLDLAGGSGSFLVHAARRLIDSYRSPRTQEIAIENVPFIIQQVKNSFYCLDINPFACYLAETNLLIQVIDLLKQVKEAGQLKECSIDRFNVYNTDSLLLPKSQDIRSRLLNPVLDLELSIVSQLKTKTGKFSEGFDFVVGNPPYVRADEPGMDIYRREIEQTGRFETLHEKWDLFVPFVELACKLAKQGSQIGLIVSRGFQTNNYAELLRDYIAKNLTILQVDFFNNIRLFSDAVVSNTIFLLSQVKPDESTTVKRVLHTDSFEQMQELDSLSQSQYGSQVFRQFVMRGTFANVVYLEDICYCTIGMVLNADEKKAKGAFTKEELISDHPDQVHNKKYLDGENMIRELAIDKIRYLEWGTNRVPDQIRRVTISELYELSKILFGMTSYPTYDRGAKQGEGFYVPDSVRICVRWDDVYNIRRLENEPRQMYEISKKRQRELGDSRGKKVQIYQYAEQKATLAQKFDLRYITAILASDFGKRFLLLNNRDENIMSTPKEGKLPKSRIYPDDLKEFPIKNISLKKQQPFIDKVEQILTINWELYQWSQGGNIIKFDYHQEETEIKINFLWILEQINPPCWNFGNAEPQRLEVIGDRNYPLQKITAKNNQILSGKTPLLESESPLVIEYLKNYLPQFEERGLSWSNLLTRGEIPQKDASITAIFAECDRLKIHIEQKIDNLRQIYQDLNKMVNKLYPEAVQLG